MPYRQISRFLPRTLTLGTLTLLGITGCQGSLFPSEPGSATAAQPNITDVAAVVFPSNSWETRPSMPTGRYGLVAATVNGVIYAIGGLFNQPLRTVEAYNPAGNTLVIWGPKALLPAARVWPSGAGVINGKIYVPGGLNGEYGPTKSLFVYNPATNAWVSKKAIPVASAQGAAGVINGKLYVYTPALLGKGPYLHRYDPGTNAWTQRATPPLGNQQPAAGVIDGKLYLAGGAVSVSPSAALIVYDPVANKWTSKKSMPKARWLATGRVLDGKLYVVGGGTADKPLALVERYDPVSNTWVARASMPTARWNLAAATANGMLYALGGLSFSGYTANEAYKP